MKKGAVLLSAMVVAVACLAGATAVASNSVVIPGLSGDSAGGSPTATATATPTSPASTLGPGTWGERDLRLTAGDDGAATLLFECGHAHIPAPLSLDSEGAFAWNGTYRAELGASTSVPGPEHPASFSGSVAGGTMALEVVVEGGFMHRTFSLTLGDPGPRTTCLTGQ